MENKYYITPWVIYGNGTVVDKAGRVIADNVSEKDAKTIVLSRKALARALPWLYKAHAEGLHKNCVMPNDLQNVIDLIEGLKDG